jgi:hypothetical protein
MKMNGHMYQLRKEAEQRILSSFNANHSILWLPQVSSDGAFRYGNSNWFVSVLECLKASGVYGMAIDVWVRL